MAGKARLGVDFGRCHKRRILPTSGDGTIFLGGTEEETLATRVVQGAFESLARLCGAFEEYVWITSHSWTKPFRHVSDGSRTIGSSRRPDRRVLPPRPPPTC
jgi:hypothetical protein